MFNFRRRFTIKKPLLPAEYKQVEYIKGSGNNTTKLFIKLPFDFTKPVEYLYTEFIRYGTNVFGILLNSATYVFGVNYKSIHIPPKTITTTINANTKTIIKYDKNQLFVNDKLLDEFASTGYSRAISYFTLFTSCQYSMSNDSLYVYDGGMACYYFELKGGDYHYKLIPCYRKEDNKGGLYDLVGKVFYTNTEGTAKFTLGPEV